MSAGVSRHLPNSKPCLKMGGPLHGGETGTRLGGMYRRGLSESSRRCVRRSSHDPVRTLSSGSLLLKKEGVSELWICYAVETYLRSRMTHLITRGYGYSRSTLSILPGDR